MAWVTLNDCLSTVSIAKGGTGANNRLGGLNNLAFIGTNPTGGTDNDTRVWWHDKGTCYAYFNQTGQLNGQPDQYGFLINIVQNTDIEIHQEFWTQPNGPHYKRGAYSGTGAMPSWTRIWDLSSALPVAKGGTGATTAAAARAAIAPKTKLWSGTLSRDGSVTISDINNWRIIGVRISLITEMLIGAVTPYLQSGSSTKTYFSCATQVDTGGGSAVYKASFTKAGTTLTLGGASKHTLPTNGASIAGSSANVLEIWGLY